MCRLSPNPSSMFYDAQNVFAFQFSTTTVMLFHLSVKHDAAHAAHRQPTNHGNPPEVHMRASFTPDSYARIRADGIVYAHCVWYSDAQQRTQNTRQLPYSVWIHNKRTRACCVVQCYNGTVAQQHRSRPDLKRDWLFGATVKSRPVHVLCSCRWFQCVVVSRAGVALLDWLNKRNIT